MKMRMLKTALAITTVAVTVFMLGCAKSKPSAATIQTATVQRGNITISSTSAGNLDFTRTENDAFDMAGTVTAVNVKVGDSVKAGEVLATLDTTAFQDQITALERTLTAKQQAVVQSEISLKNAQIALDKMTGSVNSTDVETAQAKVDSATANLQYALNNAAVASQDAQAAWQRAITLAQAELKSAEDTLNALLTNADSDQVVIAKMQVEIATSQLQSAQNAVTDAQHALDETNKGSPEVKAGLDGIVTAVNVIGGAQIQKGQVAATIADPTQFQVVVPVGEKDALSLKVGGQATVNVNAITGAILPAKIIAIAPTATVQSGVVNYQITVQVTSFLPVSGLSSFTGGALSGNQTRQIGRAHV
jgi:HlyD family secretion protein